MLAHSIAEPEWTAQHILYAINEKKNNMKLCDTLHNVW